MTTVAFLGTGTMGLPMARNLLAAGFQIRAWNRTRERAAPLRDAGAEIFDEPGDAARGAELIVTMLSDAVAVIDTAAAALEAADEGVSWLQMSTIGLEGTDRCAEIAENAGVALVDSPVLGTREPAQKGELIVLASGPENQHERCQPVFDAVGKRTVWLGEAGAGTRLKVAVNSWIVGVVGVLAETIALSQTLGVDPERFFDAVEGGPLDLPYARLKGKAMIERTFDDPSFRLALARKDADLVLAAASAHGLDLRIMEAVAQRMRAAERDGHGDEDMAATYWAGAPDRLGVM
ncbi:MAG: NAD(P)-dependent oxidoreductase [Solirubrobacteraceae bacterium]